MNKYFFKELEKIKKRILTLGALIEGCVQKAGVAINSMDVEVAKTIVETDFEIDEMEVEMEEECLKVLALHQPVAGDLRFIVAVIKINNDLERIGDQAVNIAQCIITMSKQNKTCNFKYDYSIMIEKTKYMLKRSLDALVNLDIDLAIKVCNLDDEVDEIKHNAYDQIKNVMKNNFEDIEYLLNLFLISRHLERIADHSTNIAEEVIYMIEGEIVRHGMKNKLKG